MQQQVMKELRSQRESQAVGFDASWNWIMKVLTVIVHGSEENTKWYGKYDDMISIYILWLYEYIYIYLYNTHSGKYDSSTIPIIFHMVFVIGTEVGSSIRTFGRSSWGSANWYFQIVRWAMKKTLVVRVYGGWDPTQLYGDCNKPILLIPVKQPV